MTKEWHSVRLCVPATISQSAERLTVSTGSPAKQSSSENAGHGSVARESSMYRWRAPSLWFPSKLWCSVCSCSLLFTLSVLLFSILSLLLCSPVFVLISSHVPSYVLIFVLSLSPLSSSVSRSILSVCTPMCLTLLFRLLVSSADPGVYDEIMQAVLHSGYLYKSGSSSRGTLSRKTREGRLLNLGGWVFEAEC